MPLLLAQLAQLTSGRLRMNTPVSDNFLVSPGKSDLEWAVGEGLVEFLERYVPTKLEM